MSDASSQSSTLLRGQHRPTIERLVVRNYKSIEYCDLALGPLTLIVGRNGSGKSNLLDALKFVVDGLQTSLDHAIKQRGGLDAVRRRSTGHPRNFGIQLRLSLPEHRTATYGFEVSASGRGGFVVKREQLRIRDLAGSTQHAYVVQAGEVRSSTQDTPPAASTDRLYLVTASGLPAFRAVYDALLAMGFYNLNPESMKRLQSPDAGELLHRDGANIASVVARLEVDDEPVLQRVKDYLSTIVPNVTNFERAELGPSETLRFRQPVKGANHDWRFYAQSMSDGTLRAVGALVAIHQRVDGKAPVNLVAIEEPETALHPAAAGALMDALLEASEETQILVTTHSPDLLDVAPLEDASLLVVRMENGVTSVAPLADASRAAVRDHLYLPGDLLRMDHLEPSPDHLRAQTRQLDLFDVSEGE
jgi:predicted ATPase